jgi:hypothetical protein
MNFLNNKKILLYGPCNTNIESDIKNFVKYDYILINNHMIELILPFIDKLESSSFKIIRILNGIYVEKMYELIESRDYITFFYLVSEIHTKNYLLEKTKIDESKILPLNNNYKNYGFNLGYPQMVPKTLLALDYYNVNFSLLKITGVTFYMDNKNTYNKNYCMNSIARKLWDMSESVPTDIIEKEYQNRINQTFVKENGGHYFKEQYNFFLKFLYKYKDKVKVDNTLKNIVRENPILLKI